MKKLKDVKLGESFKYGGYEWVVLEQFGEMTFVLAKDVVEEREFDKEGNTNNFEKCSLRKWLNQTFIKNFDKAALYDFKIDLLTDDGMKDYGVDICLVGLLTCDQYRKYRYLIPQIDKYWWTATAWSASAYYINYARFVSTNGNVSYSNVYYSLGVRPALLLKSDISIGDKPVLTAAEKTILENLLEEYKYIVRNLSNNNLIISTNKPFKNVDHWNAAQGENKDENILLRLKAFNHLFQFINWEDDEPYCIEELLKGANQ